MTSDLEALSPRQFRQWKIDTFLDAHFPEWAAVTHSNQLTEAAKLAVYRGLYSPFYGLRDVEGMLWRHIQRRQAC